MADSQLDPGSASGPEPLRAGADRFSGFGDLYDVVRPSPPQDLAEVLVSYAGGPPRLVIDLGCGTGLSSRWAATWAAAVVGIEPGDDMRSIAEDAGPEAVSYRHGWSHDTGLPTGSADVVLAVQALHWMEPTATLTEVARLLRPGGVFAAIDCDWPPVLGDPVVEQAWDRCRRRLWAYETRVAEGAEPEAELKAGEVDPAKYSGSDAHRQRHLVDGARSWSKSDHLERMVRSRRFEWCREFVLVTEESGNAERLVGLMKSQGDYQALRRHGLDDAQLGIEEFGRTAAAQLGDQPQPWRFTYRIRLGVSPAA